MKILLLSDGQGWVVDRIANKYKEGIPHDIEIVDYTKINPDIFIQKANEADIVHFNNADIGRLLDVLPKVSKPIIVSIRSFRYREFFETVADNFILHVIHPELKEKFPNATYISDAVDDLFQPKEFVVGMAYQDEPWNISYKGVDLVKQACEDLGITFKPAIGLSIEEMPEYYKTIDLYVCASINEGFGMPVIECLMQNIPVISTDVGIGKYTNIIKVERSVGSIKEGILAYYTYPQVRKFRWDVVCRAMTEFYQRIYDENSKK